MGSPARETISALIKDFRSGSIKALARLLSLVEDDSESTPEIISSLCPIEKQPIILGVTGPAGAGKSTLINQLLSVYKQRFAPLAVVAFDPSSRFSGGALLGDRLRMHGQGLDENIYIRSMANRGHAGGMSSRIFDVLTVLSAFGFEMVIVETLGAGQGETEVIRISDLVTVVLAPGFGDDVQAMKAGILEIADLFVVNKADLEGAEGLQNNLNGFLSLGRGGEAEASQIFLTEANQGKGIDALAAGLLEKYQRLEEDRVIAQRRDERFKGQVEMILQGKLVQLFEKEFAAELESVDLKDRDMNPYDFAERCFRTIVKQVSGK